MDPNLSLTATIYDEDQKKIASSLNSKDGNLTYQYLLPAGTYYVVLSDSWSANSSKQVYNLTVSLNTDDPNEMNNTFETATEVSLGQTIKGTLKTAKDLDYFMIKTDKAGILEVEVINIDTKMTVFAHIYDKNQAYITLASSKAGNLSLEKAVEAGTYYIRLSDSYAHGDQIYEMVVRVK